MSGPLREELRAIWRMLAQRYEWALVADEEAFLDLAAAELDDLAGAPVSSERLRVAVWRAYSRLLYRGLTRREERAAQELWLAYARMALRDGRPRPEAEELAQEAIARVLANLPELRAPQSLLAWAFRIFRTVRREYGSRLLAAQSLHPDEGAFVPEPADPDDMAMGVEHDLIGQELQALLREKLTNSLERLTLLRIVVFGDHPRDVARDLGLPLYRTRLAKHRAIERLRADEAFVRRVRDLAGVPGEADQDRSRGR